MNNGFANKGFQVESSSTYNSVNPGNLRQTRSHEVYGSKFDSFLGGVGTMVDAFGPMAVTGLQLAGKNKGAHVTAAAISGFQQAGSSVIGKGMGFPGQAPGYPGGAGGAPGMAPGYSGGGFGSTVGGMGQGDIQSQISSMFTNNMVYLGYQTQVQQNSQLFMTLSNTIKASYDAQTNTIRNFRT